MCRESGYHGFYGIESNFPRTGRRAPGEAPPQLPPEQIWENELKAVRLTKGVLERTILKA